MKEKTKDRIFWSIFAIYIILLGADFTTTLMVGEAAIALESNPIFPYVGFAGIFILNIIVAGIFIWFWYSKRPFLRYFTLIAMFATMVARVNVIPNAIFFIQNPITLEQAQAVASPEGKWETIMKACKWPTIIVLSSLIGWQINKMIRRKNVKKQNNKK